MTTRTRARQRRLELWIAAGIIVTIPSAAVALAPVGVLPLDESAAVLQTSVDPATGTFVAAAPNSRDQGAADHSLEVLATGVGSVSGLLLFSPSNSSDQGATDYLLFIPGFTLDPVVGTLIAVPSFFPVGGRILPALSVWGLLLLVALLSVLALLFIRRSGSLREI